MSYRKLNVLAWHTEGIFCVCGISQAVEGEDYTG